MHKPGARGGQRQPQHGLSPASGGLHGRQVQTKYRQYKGQPQHLSGHGGKDRHRRRPRGRQMGQRQQKPYADRQPEQLLHQLRPCGQQAAFHPVQVAVVYRRIAQNQDAGRAAPQGWKHPHIAGQPCQLRRKKQHQGHEHERRYAHQPKPGQQGLCAVLRPGLGRHAAHRQRQAGGQRGNGQHMDALAQLRNAHDLRPQQPGQQNTQQHSEGADNAVDRRDLQGLFRRALLHFARLPLRKAYSPEGKTMPRSPGTVLKL